MRIPRRRVLKMERPLVSPLHAATTVRVVVASAHVLARDAHREAKRVGGWVG